MKLFTFGLRRSGTTIFWKLLLQNTQLLSLNEPFHPKLKWLINENKRKEFQSYLPIQSMLWDTYAPIHKSEEFSPELTAGHQAYINTLINLSSHLNVDFVRSTTKMIDFAHHVPEAFIIFIYRSPQAFVSSHMLPSHGQKTIKNQLHHKLKKHTFWTRQGGYDNYSYQSIIENYFKTTFERYARENEIEQLKAYEKMLLLWKYTFEKATQAKEVIGDRMLIISFEELIDNPSKFIEHIYDFHNEKTFEHDYSILRSANLGFEPESMNWKIAFEKLKMG